MRYLIIIIVLFFTISSAQVERWVYAYNGTGNTDDEAYVVTYGDDGNIYAAGYSTGNGTDKDFTIVSLTSSGSERWVYTYNGNSDSTDIANDIVYGLDGNIYACGYCTNSATGGDILVVSLTPDGVERWTYCYSGPASPYFDRANSVTYGNDGHIYIAGASYQPYTEDDIVIISLTSQGSGRWVRRFHWDWYECAKDIIYGLDDNLYIGCRTYNWIFLDKFTVMSLNTAGTLRWIHGWGYSNFGDMAWDVVYGSDDNIYATGMEGVHFIVRSYDTLGNYRWTYWPGQQSWGYALVYGRDDNIYAVGHDGYSNPVFRVVSLTNAGDTNWTYSGSGNGDSEGRSIVYGLDDKVYTAGWSTGTSTFLDFTIMRLDTTGTEDWIYRYNGSGNGSDKAYSIVYGTDDNIYAAGYCYDSLTNNDFLVISLDTSTTGIVEHESNTVIGHELMFPSLITDAFLFPDGKNCRVFDITGRVVAPDKIKPGIYFIEINGVIAKKVVKVR